MTAPFSVREREGVGRSVRRLEDAALLTGHGSFIDDINLPGQVHAFLIRSPHAHARIGHIDERAALAMPGVVAVLTGADLAADGVGRVHCPSTLRGRDGAPIRNPPRTAMPCNRVRHVGDTVAIVLAESLAHARDAAEAVVINYEPLAAVTDARAALAPGAPLVWDDIPGNLALDWASGDRAGIEAAFAAAAHVTRLDLVVNRVAVAAIEPRGALAAYDAVARRYTVYTPTQGASAVQAAIAQYGLGVPIADVRVVTRDVGGGFGMKNYIYPEQILMPWAARRIGRPVKWYPERSDSFVTDAHARDHFMQGELALGADGRFLAIRVRTVSNMGAYLTTSGPVIPTEGGSRMLANVYRIPAAYAETRLAFTNTVPIDAYRGAGKPEFCYLVERLVDAAARERGIDPAALRERNLIRPVELPWRTPTGLVYDSGDFGRNMRQALRLADRDGFAARRRAARDRGRLRGFGFAVYTEPDGYKDGRVAMRFDPNGALTLTLTAQSNGQGHATTFGQVAADRLGVPLEAIRVLQGDSDVVGVGTGTGGSRTATVAGTAIHLAAEKIVEKGRQIAAQLLEAAAEDVEFADGRFTVAGTDRGVGIAEVARASFSPAAVPLGHDLGLEATSHYVARAYSYPSGCHVCEAEIDPETGAVRIVRYAVVNDFGTAINPMLLEGQIHGGIAQGAGQALWEDCVYDPETGQLLTGSFMDFCLPRADDLPFIDWERVETPCATNPLGVKGAGESGTTASLPAVVNAVVDALAELGVRHADMPLTPEKVWRLIRGARS